MRDRLRSAAQSRSVVALASGALVAFELVGDSWRAGFTVRDGVVAPIDPGPETWAADFTLVAGDKVWEELSADRPMAGEHSIGYLVRTGVVELTGNPRAYDRNVQIVRALVDAAREGSVHAEIGKPLRAVGAYHRVSTSLGTSDIYIERAGSGIPLLAFATAGSDISQWHGVITHSDLTDRFELITVDLPWHGRSSPSWGDPVGSYQLTPETYTEFIVAMCDVLELDHPVLLGVSMGGAAVVHSVATHPDRFAGAVSCQTGTSVKARKNEHLRGTRVNPTLFIPEWTYGLMNPASPEEFKQRVWWGYSSGGFGLYAADIDSYQSWDFTLIEHLLTAKSPHIALLSGAFDTSVPPERSRELASRIPNSSFELMSELGHFPHAENPAAFVRYLEQALAQILDSGEPHSR